MHNVFICPNCMKKLEISENKLFCSTCHKEFSSVGNIVNFIVYTKVIEDIKKVIIIVNKKAELDINNIKIFLPNITEFKVIDSFNNFLKENRRNYQALIFYDIDMFNKYKKILYSLFMNEKDLFALVLPELNFYKMNKIAALKSYLNPYVNGPLAIISKKTIDNYYYECLHNNNFAIDFKNQYLASVENEQGFALDFGCGRGRICAILKNLGYSVIGMDLYSSQYWDHIDNVSFAVGNEDSLMYLQPNTFSLITVIMVLGYIKDDISLLKNLNNLLNENGAIVLEVFNKENYRTKIFKKPAVVETYPQKYYTIEEISNILTDNGFKILELDTIKFYSPIFPKFFNFIYEIILNEKQRKKIDKLIPYRNRGKIRILAKKDI